MEPSFYFVRDSKFSELPRPPPPTYSSPNISWVFEIMRCADPEGDRGSGPPEILKANELLNGVSLAGRCWPAFSGIWILSSLENILSVLQSWTPSDKTFWIRAWKESIYR